MIQHLDGEHDRVALLEKLLRQVASGNLKANQQDGKAVSDETGLRALFTRAIDTGLGNLAKSALLIQ